MRKNLFTTMLVCIIASMSTFSIAQENIQPYIDMQAKVEREVAPNELYITIGIKESDYKGKKSLQQMQDILINVLKANNIDIAEDLSLSYMGSNVSYKVFSKRVVPRTQATYILKLQDAATMQKVIYELEEKEITNISLTRTKYTNEDTLITELGVEALKKAQEQARAYAAAVGQEIGKAISISSWNSQSSPQPRMYKANLMLSAASEESRDEEAPAIQVSKLTYIVNVSVRFQLQ